MATKFLAFHKGFKAEESAVDEVGVTAIEAIDQAIVSGAVEVGKCKEGENVVDATSSKAILNALKPGEEGSAVFGGALFELDELKNGQHDAFWSVGIELGD